MSAQRALSVGAAADGTTRPMITAGGGTIVAGARIVVEVAGRG
ncbi:hypothetical protein ACWDOP_34995 [Nocardia sp. NPDC003693]